MWDGRNKSAVAWKDEVKGEGENNRTEWEMYGGKWEPLGEEGRKRGEEERASLAENQLGIKMLNDH